MEYVEGRNLLELIDARGPLPPAATVAAGLQILEGLLHAHSQGVLHLDLSPANILISKSGSAKLIDFGLAGKNPKGPRRTIVGTPAFLSPEHVAGEPGTTGSDLFSFGSLLYYAVTGAPLFDPGEDNSKVTHAVREIGNARANPPEDRVKRLPQFLSKPILTALRSREPERLLAELTEAWKKLGVEERPEAALRRESEPDADPPAPGSDRDGLPEGRELRDRYIRLRGEGRHREAVALLERALRREPDNPMLRELLTTPPARVKSAPATVSVGAMALSHPQRPTGSAAARKYAAGFAALIVAALGFAAMAKSRRPSEPMPAAAAGVASAPSEPAPRTPESPAPVTSTLPKAAPADRGSRLASVQAGTGPASRARRAASARTHRPPAIALAGPAGTKVTLDDTAEWVSPGPANGWPLSPGLVNITLTPPDGSRPISSSLYVSADTLYLLSMEGDGGFSVTRKRR
jgi:hypothetical protein